MNITNMVSGAAHLADVCAATREHVDVHVLDAVVHAATGKHVEVHDLCCCLRLGVEKLLLKWYR